MFLEIQKLFRRDVFQDKGFRVDAYVFPAGGPFSQGKIGPGFLNCGLLAPVDDGF